MRPKDFFAQYLSTKHWLIREETWDSRRQGVCEAQFTLGNGYLGNRGVLEEIPYHAYPGTYIAGVYDKAGAQVTELVNLPNPIDFKIIARGEKVGMITMDVLEHQRVLDMQKGLLKRRTLYLNSKKERFDYQSLRFLSLSNVHVGAMKIYFTPLDNDTDIIVETGVDTAVTNKGVLTEGKKRHFQIIEVSHTKDISYICVRTFESRISVYYASYLKVFDGKKNFSNYERTFHLKINKNQTVSFTKIFSIFTSRDTILRKIKGYTTRTLRQGIKMGFGNLLKQHSIVWENKWRMADVCIEPDKDLQKILRFNIYHMLICGNESDSKVSIPARTLSGEGYRGHIFWDTEIFLLPFFIYTNPSVARNILYYRFHTLDVARLNAKQRGFRGALFSWESADTGRDCTPTWHKDLDGRVIRIRTGELEHHVVGAVAYGIYYYYLVTDDKDFMLDAGLELMFETARFWASRIVHDRNDDLYHIRHLIGPDEFHIDVDDNAYTNTLAKWNLLTAFKLYNKKSLKFDQRFKKLIKKINLGQEEVNEWRRISRRLFIPTGKDGDLIESFQGYFKKKDMPIRQLDSNFMPILPKGLLFKDAGKTQLIKQADVVLLLHLFPENYTLKQKRENFLYYDKRTLHKSSLSPCIYAILGWETGNFTKAYHYFLYSLYADLMNMHGNTADGIHAASLGGTWQAVINGFAGMRIIDGKLSFNPHLPPNLKALKFKVKYRGSTLDVHIGSKTIEILPQGEKRRIKLRVYGKEQELLGSRKFKFSRPIKEENHVKG